ncbi:transposase [Streptomyces sioyaensis]|uniref:transposase n=1 Tax=Streptomyces sioyaensis TaxID=67364 RepID=UPI0033C84343
MPDGSYLTRIAGLTLRVIEAEIRTRTADGSAFGETYRLLTTLTDHRTDPAHQLVRLYHERWEIECTYLALRHTLLKGRVLRSKDPAGVTQEVWGLLALYQALRSVMVTAVETRPGTDPDRAAFIVALEAARDTVVLPARPTAAPGQDTQTVLVGHIGSRLLRAVLPNAVRGPPPASQSAESRATTPGTAINAPATAPPSPPSTSRSRHLLSRLPRIRPGSPPAPGGTSSAGSLPRAPTNPCTPTTSPTTWGSRQLKPAGTSPPNSASGLATVC